MSEFAPKRQLDQAPIEQNNSETPVMGRLRRLIAKRKGMIFAALLAGAINANCKNDCNIGGETYLSCGMDDNCNSNCDAKPSGCKRCDE